MEKNILTIRVGSVDEKMQLKIKMDLIHRVYRYSAIILAWPWILEIRDSLGTVLIFDLWMNLMESGTCASMVRVSLDRL